MKFRGFIGQSYTLRNSRYDCTRTVNLFPSTDETKLGKGGEIVQFERTPGLTYLAGYIPAPCSPVIIFQDTFTNANVNHLGGHVPDVAPTGFTWNVTGQDQFSIATNRLTLVSSPSSAQLTENFVPAARQALLCHFDSNPIVDSGPDTIPVSMNASPGCSAANPKSGPMSLVCNDHAYPGNYVAGTSEQPTLIFTDDDFYIGCWVWATGLVGTYGSGDQFIIDCRGTGGSGPYIKIKSTGQLEFGDGLLAGTSTATISSQVWHLVELRKVDTTGTLYLDEEVVATCSFPDSYSQNGEIAFGAAWYYPFGVDSLGGYIDELSIRIGKESPAINFTLEFPYTVELVAYIGTDNLDASIYLNIVDETNDLSMYFMYLVDSYGFIFQTSHDLHSILGGLHTFKFFVEENQTSLQIDNDAWTVDLTGTQLSNVTRFNLYIGCNDPYASLPSPYIDSLTFTQGCPGDTPPGE